MHKHYDGRGLRSGARSRLTCPAGKALCSGLDVFWAQTIRVTRANECIECSTWTNHLSDTFFLLLWLIINIGLFRLRLINERHDPQDTMHDAQSEASRSNAVATRKSIAWKKRADCFLEERTANDEGDVIWRAIASERERDSKRVADNGVLCGDRHGGTQMSKRNAAVCFHRGWPASRLL